MPRPVSISDDQILDAARALFLDHGFEASTAEIARRADVSEGTIFKRFPTKEALFQAALGLPDDPPWVERWPALVGTGDPRRHLLTITAQTAALFQDVVPRFLALQSRGVGRHLADQATRERPLARMHQALAAYLEREMDLNRLRRADPIACADTLLGAAFLARLFTAVGLREDAPDSASASAERIIDLVWLGLAPGPEA